MTPALVGAKRARDYLAPGVRGSSGRCGSQVPATIEQTTGKSLLFFFFFNTTNELVRHALKVCPRWAQEAPSGTGRAQKAFSLWVAPTMSRSCNLGILITIEHFVSGWAVAAHGGRTPTTVDTFYNGACLQLRFGYSANARRSLIVHVLVG